MDHVFKVITILQYTSFILLKYSQFTTIFKNMILKYSRTCVTDQEQLNYDELS